MKKESLKNWFVRVFARDIDLPKNSLVYLFFSLLAIFLIIEVYLYKYTFSTKMVSVINIEIVVILLITAISFLTSVILVDKIKKRTRHFNLALLFCIIGILVLSFFLISYGSFIDETIIFGMPRIVFLSIHYAFSLLPLILAIQTISGDFSTERGNLKYRGRIYGLFLALMFMGIIIGFIFSRWINGLYTDYPEFNKIFPDFPNLLSGFVIVILLVWMMAMKEFLISKEKDWPAAVINLYVFSVNGVGLYYHNFKKSLQGEEKEKKREMDKDLISGALTGVVAIISEITQSKKQLRKIDKEGYHLLFSFGKYHVTCLISKIDLPVLLKKLDEFSKDFGIKFGKNLKNFVGNIAPFDSTKYLVNKYFSQKYAFLFK